MSSQRILELALLTVTGSIPRARRARWPEERIAGYALVGLAVAAIAWLL